MIPVILAKAPKDFDIRVRLKGLDAIAELVGESPKTTRPGPKRKAVATRRRDIPPEAFPPYWRDVLDDMLTAYGRLCAYLALYIHHATGSPSVDHVLPKSKAWRLVYEWSNYRLACTLINSKKSDLDLALDPFALQSGWFELEVVEFQVKPGSSLSTAQAQRVEDTIATLGLNRRDCCRAREKYAEDYEKGETTLAHLEKHAPLVAQELRRQGRLVRGDK